MKGHIKTKRTKTTKRRSKLLLKLRSWGNYIDEAYQLESLLTKKPARLQIEFVGSGEIPADTALLMRSMILKRSPRTRIITNARSSLQGATALIWLLGENHPPTAWKILHSAFFILHLNVPLAEQPRQRSAKPST